MRVSARNIGYIPVKYRPRPLEREFEHALHTPRQLDGRQKSALWLARCRNHLSDHAGHRRCDGICRGDDPAAASGIRLGYCRYFLGNGRQAGAFRPAWAFCRRLHESFRRPAGGVHRARPDHGRHRRLLFHDRGMAIAAALGRGDRCRHRHDRPGIGRHRGGSLVFQASRIGDRPHDGEQCHWPAGLSAAAGGADGSLWLANRPYPVRGGNCHGHGSRPAFDARPSCRCRPAGLWRDRGGKAGQAGSQSSRHIAIAAGDAEERIGQPGLLGAFRHIFCLRAFDQRSYPDTLDFNLR
ncbi:hypothetical protein D3C72_1030160 [compost metagenome]